MQQDVTTQSTYSDYDDGDVTSCHVTMPSVWSCLYLVARESYCHEDRTWHNLSGIAVYGATEGTLSNAYFK